MPTMQEARMAQIRGKLEAVLVSASDPLFAVIDGASFDDLPFLLSQNGMTARSLFRDAAPDVSLAGPWLTSVRTERAKDLCLQVATVHSCLVFWSSSVSEEKLLQHLRKLNLVSTPSLRKELKREKPKYKHSLFRHWDPTALAISYPVLDDGQKEFFLGPASMIALYSPDARMIQKHVAGESFSYAV